MNSNSARGENKNTNAGGNTNTTGETRQTPASVRGTWGGLHISIEVTASGAEINYDCAHGSITEAIAPDREGKFVVKGVHVTEHPGPIREGEDNSQPATYSGSIEGETMTLTVTLAGTGEAVDTFTLTRGKAGRVRKCL